MRFLGAAAGSILAAIVGYKLADDSFALLVATLLATVVGLGVLATLLAVFWPRHGHDHAPSHEHVRF